jgi:hypothetical protein
MRAQLGCMPALCLLLAVSGDAFSSPVRVDVLRSGEVIRSAESGARPKSESFCAGNPDVTVSFLESVTSTPAGAAHPRGTSVNLAVTVVVDAVCSSGGMALSLSYDVLPSSTAQPGIDYTAFPPLPIEFESLAQFSSATRTETRSISTLEVAGQDLRRQLDIGLVDAVLVTDITGFPRVQRFFGDETPLHSIGIGGGAAGSVLKSATWWNPAESGWGLFTVDQGNVIAPGWFTYDETGKPTWFLVPGALQQPDGSYTGSVCQFTGSPLAQVNGNAADPCVSIGSARLRFIGNSQLRFDYTVNGNTQSKSLTRFNFSGSDIICEQSPTPSRAAATNYSDLWWAGPESTGWGVHISHVENDLFATWYTYGTDRKAIFYVGALSRQSDVQFSGPLFRQNNGTPFLNINGSPASSGAAQVGFVTLTFLDGERATFTYTVSGVNRSRSISRFQFGSVASVCRVSQPGIQTQVNPFDNIEISGTYDQNLIYSIVFVDENGQRYPVPGEFNTSGDLTAVVPPAIDFQTMRSLAAGMSYEVWRVNPGSSDTQLAMTSPMLRVTALPDIDAAPGSISLAYYNQLIAVAQDSLSQTLAIDNATQGVVSSELIEDLRLSDFLASMIDTRELIESLVGGVSQVEQVGQLPDGTPIVISLENLALMDRILWQAFMGSGASGANLQTTGFGAGSKTQVGSLNQFQDVLQDFFSSPESARDSVRQARNLFQAGAAVGAAALVVAGSVPIASVAATMGAVAIGSTLATSISGAFAASLVNQFSGHALDEQRSCDSLPVTYGILADGVADLATDAAGGFIGRRLAQGLATQLSGASNLYSRMAGDVSFIDSVLSPLVGLFASEGSGYSERMIQNCTSIRQFQQPEGIYYVADASALGQILVPYTFESPCGDSQGQTSLSFLGGDSYYRAPGFAYQRGNSWVQAACRLPFGSLNLSAGQNTGRAYSPLPSDLFVLDLTLFPGNCLGCTINSIFDTTIFFEHHSVDSSEALARVSTSGVIEGPERQFNCATELGQPADFRSGRLRLSWSAELQLNIPKTETDLSTFGGVFDLDSFIQDNIDDQFDFRGCVRTR